MPFVPATNVAEFELRQRLDGQAIENTLYFEHLDTGPSVDELELFGGILAAWWRDSLAPSLTTNSTLPEVYATSLSTISSPAVTIALSPPYQAGVAAGFVPNNCALCVSFRTPSRGRSYRGRNYIAGIPALQVVANTVSVATTNAIAAAYEELLTIGDGHNWTWGVLSRFAAHAPRVAGVFTPITAVVILDRTIDSQRRRLPGRGR